jgi:hypothetical protein
MERKVEKTKVTLEYLRKEDGRFTIRLIDEATGNYIETTMTAEEEKECFEAWERSRIDRGVW